MEWCVAHDMYKEVMDFYLGFIVPNFASHPDVLRLRVFEVANATSLQGDTYITKEKDDELHRFFTMVEFATEDWPWESVIELSGNEKWLRYFDSQTAVVSMVAIVAVQKLMMTEMATQPLLSEESLSGG